MLTVSLAPSSDFDAGTPSSAQANIADKPSQQYYFTQIPDPSRRAPGDDADEDGNANAIEYFMGTDPGNAGSKSALGTTRLENASVKVFYPRAKNHPDISGRLIWSANLLAWFESGASDGLRTVVITESVAPPPGADPETVEATLAVTGDSSEALFFRLVVVE